MRKPILYTRAGGPPNDWPAMHVLCDGKPVQFVTEAAHVSSSYGWALHYEKDADGNFRTTLGGVELLSVLTQGNITIKRGKLPMATPDQNPTRALECAAHMKSYTPLGYEWACPRRSVLEEQTP